MSYCTASLLATMISSSQTETGRKRESGCGLARSKSYRVIEKRECLRVCAGEHWPGNTFKHHCNNLAPLFEERRVKTPDFVGPGSFRDNCRGCDMIRARVGSKQKRGKSE